MILNALKIIGRGFLLGVGFGIAMGGAYFGIWKLSESRASSDFESRMTKRHEDAIKDLVLVDVEEQKHDGETAILGSVRNNGTETHDNVEVQANLFNHGKFVDQYSTYVRGKIDPGASVYFKISCGCSHSPPAEHDSFKVEVVKSF